MSTDQIRRVGVGNCTGGLPKAYSYAPGEVRLLNNSLNGLLSKMLGN